METAGSGSVTGTLVVVLLSLFLWWIYKTRHLFQTIQKMGLPGPSPSFLIGNMKFMTKEGFANCFKIWEKQYGPVYGIYRAKRPSIVIHDPDMLREVMVRQFDTFRNRLIFEITTRKPYCNMLQFMIDDQWKHVRKTLSPSFSSGKLKAMVPVIQRGCRNLVQRVTQMSASGEEVDIKDLSNAFSMDITAGTGFGIEVNCLLNPDETFGVIAKRILYPPQWRFTLLLMVPALASILSKVGITLTSPRDSKYMFDIIRQALKDRRQNPDKKYKDHLQCLVDAEREDRPSPVDPELDYSQELGTKPSWSRKGLTEDEIESNSLNFLLAGYENTASGMAFLLYNLAGSPHCLEKLQQEVDSVLGQDEVDYRAVTNMPYLDMCLNESLRLFPPGFLLDRECMEDTEVKGLRVPKGMLVTIPVYSIHTNPAHWPDPFTFDPERHTAEAKAERHPFSFIPFGMGPRNCIGMRMSQMEVKMAVVAIVQKFSPVLGEKAVFPAKLSNHVRLGPVDTMWVKFQPRSA